MPMAELDRPDSVNSPPIVRQPKGFGGWLIIPAFHTLTMPLFYAWSALDFLQETRAPSFSTYKGLILYNLTTSAVLTVGWSVVLVGMVRKKRWYPWGFAIVGAASLAYAAFQPGLPFSTISWIGRAGMAGPFWDFWLYFCYGWTVYLFKSVRVKNTFDRAGVIGRVD
jgi:hypothetical protein